MPKWKLWLCQRGVLLIALLRKARSSTYHYNISYRKGLFPKQAEDFIISGFISGAVYCFFLETVVALELPPKRLVCTR